MYLIENGKSESPYHRLVNFPLSREMFSKEGTIMYLAGIDRFKVYLIDKLIRKQK